MVKMPKPFVDAIDRAKEHFDKQGNRRVPTEQFVQQFTNAEKHLADIDFADIERRMLAHGDIVGTMLYETAKAVFANSYETWTNCERRFVVRASDMAALQTAIRLVDRKKALGPK